MTEKDDALQAKFTEIFNENHWGSDESISGTGSSFRATSKLVDQLSAIIQRYEIRSMVDAPCGDFNWIAPVAAMLDYRGYDLVEGVVKIARERADYAFEVADVTRSRLPRSDAIFCRDCLVHLMFRPSLNAINLFKESGSKWLITTTFPDIEANLKGRNGGWRPINLNLSPFFLPEPTELIVERPDIQPNPRFGRKCLGMWSLDEITV